MGRRQHGPLEKVPGIQEAGGVQEDHLGPVGGQDSRDALPGGLGLGGDDAEPLAEEGVHGGGLPGVGPPHQGHVAATGAVFLSGMAVGVWIVIGRNFPEEVEFGNAGGKQKEPAPGRPETGSVKKGPPAWKAEGPLDEAGSDVLSHRINQQYHPRGGA